MGQSRRDFFRITGAAGAGLAALRWSSPGAQAATPVAKGPKGMAKGLTLLSIKKGDEVRLACKTDKGIFDVKDAATRLKLPAPSTMDELLQDEQGPNLTTLVAAATKSAATTYLKEDAIEYAPLVGRPEKIVCVGLNYRKHAQEINMPIPKVPVLFNKFNNTLNRHKGSIKLPVEVANHFDYEVELVILIGKTAHNVTEADALSYVAGYATGNDFSARDLQLETGGQWMVGKTPDQFAPIGPYFVTADQVDPDNLKIECRVNGEQRQMSNTNDFIFNTKQQVSYISKMMTLRPGDIIFTGTPQGVILGKAKDKQVWLKAGDKVACSLEKLGELTFDLV